VGCDVGCNAARSPVAVAMAQASDYSSHLTPSLVTSIRCGCGHKKTKDRKKEKKSKVWILRDIYNTT